MPFLAWKLFHCYRFVLETTVSFRKNLLKPEEHFKARTLVKKYIYMKEQGLKA
jgi:hypothetical protein